MPRHRKNALPELRVANHKATPIDEGKEDGGPSNLTRAEWAREALSLFARSTRMLSDTNEEDLETIVSDFLADLMHLCRLNGLDFEQRLDNARIHHEAERRGEE